MILALALLAACGGTPPADTAAAPVLGPCEWLAPTGGDVRYVILGAPPGGDGTADAPFASIAAALAAAEPGWDLRLGEGEWVDPLDLDAERMGGMSVRGCVASGVTVPGVTIRGGVAALLGDIGVGATEVDGGALTLVDGMSVDSLTIPSGSVEVTGFVDAGPVELGPQASLTVAEGGLLEVRSREGRGMTLGADATASVAGEATVDGTVEVGPGAALGVAGQLDVTGAYEDDAVALDCAAGATVTVGGSLTVTGAARQAAFSLGDGARLEGTGWVEISARETGLSVGDGAVAALADGRVMGATGIEVNGGELAVAGAVEVGGSVGLSIRGGGTTSIAGELYAGDADEAAVEVDEGGRLDVAGTLRLDVEYGYGLLLAGDGTLVVGAAGGSIEVPGGGAIRVGSGASFEQGGAGLEATSLWVGGAVTLDGTAAIDEVDVSAGGTLLLAGDVAAGRVQVYADSSTTLAGSLLLTGEGSGDAALLVDGQFEALDGSSLVIQAADGIRVGPGGNALLADTEVTVEWFGVLSQGTATIGEGSTFTLLSDAVAIYAQYEGVVLVDGAVAAAGNTNVVTAESGGVVDVGASGSLTLDGPGWGLYVLGGTVRADGAVVVNEPLEAGVYAEAGAEIWLADLTISGAGGVGVHAVDSLLSLGRATITDVARGGGGEGDAVFLDHPLDGGSIGQLTATDGARAALLVSDGSVALGEVVAARNGWSVVQQACGASPLLDVSGLTAYDNGDDAPHLCDGTELPVR